MLQLRLLQNRNQDPGTHAAEEACCHFQLQAPRLLMPPLVPMLSQWLMQVQTRPLVLPVAALAAAAEKAAPVAVRGLPMRLALPVLLLANVPGQAASQHHMAEHPQAHHPDAQEPMACAQGLLVVIVVRQMAMGRCKVAAA